MEFWQKSWLFLLCTSHAVHMKCVTWSVIPVHYCDVIMGAIASRVTSLTTIYSRVHSGADQRKYQSSPPSLAFVRGIHRWPVNSPHKGPVTRKMFPFDDVIMYLKIYLLKCWWYGIYHGIEYRIRIHTNDRYSFIVKTSLPYNDNQTVRLSTFLCLSIHFQLWALDSVFVVQ